jgi:F-type H+-transporting ATPase subunit gamma
MASLKETKKRIVSVKNTQKITRAMKLVSSAKYARSVRCLLASRPYRREVGAMALRVLNAGEGVPSLMVAREEKKSLLLVVSTDRGLCGSLNTNVFKKTQSFVLGTQENKQTCAVGLWGRKAVNFGSKLEASLWQTLDRQAGSFPFSQASVLADNLCREFLRGEFDAVYIAYSHYENALTQKATVTQLLPLSKAFLQGAGGVAARSPASGSVQGADLLEPGREQLLPALLQSALASEIYHCFLSSVASEHAARMTAMDNATNNADDVISNLTLAYNQARQAAITKELIEITSGAEAL